MRPLMMPRVESRKTPVEMLVVTHMEKVPTDNQANTANLFPGQYGLVVRRPRGAHKVAPPPI
jgi:hypothetical protein